MPSSLRTAQLTIFLLPDGTPKAESIGRNGTRRKIDLDFDFADRNPEIMCELRSQQDEERARSQRELREIQSANIDYVVRKHGDITAEKVWHNGELVFNRAWKRYLDHEAADSAPVAKRMNTAGKRATAAITINMDEI